ncbi:MAG: DNA-processing protein DprA [Firmicutes bacterium]|nr:DNA-processing protein DprA [Bacillota bacterium]
MQNRQYWIYWQMLMPGAGRRVWDLVNYFGSPKQAWEAAESELSEIPFIGRDGAKKLVKRRESLQYGKLVEHLKKLNCAVFTIEDEAYPSLLKTIYDPPPAVFVRGALPSGEKAALAMVGSRQPTPYGLAAAESLAGELAGAGLTIISGMARGIDSAAHRGALKVNGSTVAVLGCGPDVVYPRENERLMKQILEKGAVLTEFPPGTAPKPWHFPCRNRIISGLSSAVLVVEAAEKSGALITADFALEQGREVLAIPGNINSSKSAGANKLIRQGARLITRPADVLEELGLGDISLHNRCGKGLDCAGLTGNEKKVMQALTHLPMSLEQIIDECRLEPKEVAAALTVLELKGFTRILPGKMYAAAGL